ncbi:hypothetical protein [Canicola haemoglobinophilus]|uniref:hypothetical protein n=1 Tax=Canicola haemoglobinophilus TaxID=733 RepID=UPI0015F1A6CB|nr:hypothetical protein [Canicola haemoglobinophilus]
MKIVIKKPALFYDAGFIDPVFYALAHDINHHNGHNNRGNHRSAVIHLVISKSKKRMR